MKMNFKKTLAAVFMCVLVFSLSGCGKIDLGVNTTINENGSGQITLTTALSGIFAQQTGSTSDFEAGKTGIIEGSDVNNNNIKTETKEENGIKTTTSTFTFNTLDELNGLVKNTEDSDLAINVEKKSSFFKTEYTYVFKLPSSFTVDSVMKELENNPDLSSNELIDKNTIYNFIGSAVTLKNTLTVPGKLVSSNAYKTEGNTLTWENSLSQIKSGDIYTATYEIPNKTNIAGAAAGGIIIFAICVVLLIRRRKA